MIETFESLKSRKQDLLAFLQANPSEKTYARIHELGILTSKLEKHYEKRRMAKRGVVGGRAFRGTMRAGAVSIFS